MRKFKAEEPSDFWRNSVPRGLALFFGGFALLNLVGELRAPGFDSNIWWVDLRNLPPAAAQALLGAVSIFLIAFTFVPPISRGRQLLTGLLTAGVGIMAMVNVVQFYTEFSKGNIKTAFPVPLSLFVAIAFMWIAGVSLAASSTMLDRNRFVGISFVFLCSLVIFPVLQVICFGKTDYRRKADVAVVLGARAYADGRPSDALADRVRTACQLYKEGAVKQLIFSGGPGDGEVHETESMRRFAIKNGVAEQDIYADTKGLNTQATVENTAPLFKKLDAKKILVVSHFYHLPRIKMTYKREGWDVYTVPAQEKYFLRETPYMVAREIAALWVYYLRPLRA